ncbi:hypothetical protein RM844_28580 [Streptomyces sp. DSM 44915]|uniref:AraC family transcriptional regulator n=1 Tax=Streptomyces chisholmiae TaxID=3075540 RepID=A0ABU2K1B6_9ACTN|nr:hypothetical protein [Streptomyces sp. DSM 44915]MDT0270233.1 hypothetical protein [Streptomyces sp. DSM 44915]
MSAPERAYPLPHPDSASTLPRFTLGLVLDIADVLERHGFPPVRAGEDLLDLHTALYRFLYGSGGGQR